MSSPKKNATPAQMAGLAKLNQKLYGTKRPEPTRPTPPMEPTRPTRPTPPKPERPLPPREPVGTQMNAPLPPREPVGTQMNAPLRPTGKPSNRMEYKKGGSVSSASKRADGIATIGKSLGKCI